MADAAPKPQRVKKTREASGPTGPDRPRKQRRKQRRSNPGLLKQNPVVTTRKYLRREVKKELKREGLEGPKVAVQQKITSTFGLVGPNSSGNTELELNFFCHPSLAKEANDGTAFGPLQALAAQYALWKLKHLTLRFTPMVGASAVSGTVVRASLNLSQSPGGSNWSGLGTRLHIDMHPGQTAVFNLRCDQVGGPRDGGWWFTDTNEEGSQSAGPIVEVHTLGKTLSTFKDDAWTGPLFLVEGVGVWQFANYQVKPALGSLERREEDVTATISADSGQPIVLDLPTTSEVAAFMDGLEPVLVDPVMRDSTQSVGETIFQVVDTGAQLASAAAPPPFGWLIKGGWWFVKKLLGKARTGHSQFVVYASLSDAQNNKPAIATGSVVGQPKPTRLMVTQINSPNVGPNPIVHSLARAGKQTLQPGMTFRLHAEMLSELFITMNKKTTGGTINIPVSIIPGVTRKSDGEPTNSGDTMAYIQTPWWVGRPGTSPPSATTQPSTLTGGYVHTLYRLFNPEFTDQSGDLEYYPPEPLADMNFCWNDDFNTNGTIDSTHRYVVVGKVIASNVIQAGSTPPIAMTFNLIKTINEIRFDNDKVRDMIMVIADNKGDAIINDTPRPSDYLQNSWPIVERTIPIGTYLLSVSYTNAPASLEGIHFPTTLAKGTFPRTESTVAAIFPYYLAGQLFPATSADLTLTYPAKDSVDGSLLRQLRMLKVQFEEPTSTPADEPISWAEAVEIEENLQQNISDSDDTLSVDSVEEFWCSLGNEMINIPKRWSHLFGEDGELKEDFRRVEHQ